jgi:acetyl-CoA synthetase
VRAPGRDPGAGLLRLRGAGDRARLQHSEAKVVVTADGSLRRGREVPMKALVDEALEESPSVEHVVVWRGSATTCRCSRPRRLLGRSRRGSPGELEPLEVDSEHPYLLTYTSGTTGQPKGVLHVQGGFLVSITREGRLPGDARPGDVDPLRHRHGLDHGPVGGGRRDGARLHDRLRRGAPDWPRPPTGSGGSSSPSAVSILGLSPDRCAR